MGRSTSFYISPVSHKGPASLRFSYFITLNHARVGVGPGTGAQLFKPW